MVDVAVPLVIVGCDLEADRVKLLLLEARDPYLESGEHPSAMLIDHN